MQDHLDNWQLDCPPTNDEEIKEFAVSKKKLTSCVQNELWMSLAEFEKQLKEQVTGYELELIHNKNYYMEKEEYLKDKFQFKLEIYESSIRETKILARRQVE